MNQRTAAIMIVIAISFLSGGGMAALYLADSDMEVVQGGSFTLDCYLNAGYVQFCGRTEWCSPDSCDEFLMGCAGNTSFRAEIRFCEINDLGLRRGTTMIDCCPQTKCKCYAATHACGPGSFVQYLGEAQSCSLDSCLY